MNNSLNRSLFLYSLLVSTGECKEQFIVRILNILWN